MDWSKKMRSGNTKERLIEAALELFSQKGFDATSVDEIARAVGIKGPSIYDHFKNKEAILQEIVARADEEYDKNIENGREKTVNIRSGEDLKQYAMHAIAFTINNDMAIKMRKLVAIEQFRISVLSDRATRQNITNLKRFYSGVFAKLMAEGLMVKGNPEIIALEFVAPITLLIQMSDREKDKQYEVMKTIEEHMDVFVERFFIKQ